MKKEKSSRVPDLGSK